MVRGTRPVCVVAARGNKWDTAMTAIDLVNKIRRLTPQGKYVLTNVQAVALIKQLVAESGGKQ